MTLMMWYSSLFLVLEKATVMNNINVVVLFSLLPCLVTHRKHRHSTQRNCVRNKANHIPFHSPRVGSKKKRTEQTLAHHRLFEHHIALQEKRTALLSHPSNHLTSPHNPQFPPLAQLPTQKQTKTKLTITNIPPPQIRPSLNQPRRSADHIAREKDIMVQGISNIDSSAARRR